jgi:hypothetical protein
VGFSSFLDSYRQFDSHPTPQCSSVSQSEFGGGGGHYGCGWDNSSAGMRLQMPKLQQKCAVERLYGRFALIVEEH